MKQAFLCDNCLKPFDAEPRSRREEIMLCRMLLVTGDGPPSVCDACFRQIMKAPPISPLSREEIELALAMVA